MDESLVVPTTPPCGSTQYADVACLEVHKEHFCCVATSLITFSLISLPVRSQPKLASRLSLMCKAKEFHRADDISTMFEVERQGIQSQIEENRRKIILLYVALNSKTHIMRLPIEMLTEIFFLCHENRGPIAKIGDSPPTPLIIASVCHFWREIALGTPRLWSILNIRFSKKRHLTQETLLREWLTRSAKYPLSICLDDTYCTYVPLDACYSILAVHAQSWRTVVFKGNTFYSFHSFLYMWHSGPCKPNFPLLSSVHIIRDYGFPIEGPNFDGWALNSPLALRELRIFVPTQPPTSGIQWNMLQHLSASFDAAGFLSMASLLLSLQTLSLLIKPPLGDSETFNLQAPAETICLPRLTEFKVYVDDEDGFIGLSDVFSSLSLPVLRHFEFNTGDLNGIWFQAFISMLRQSEGCQLAKLVLVNKQLAQEDLVPLFNLPALSPLTYLHLDGKDRRTGACPLSEIEMEALNPRLTRNSGHLSACLLSLKVLSCRGYFRVEDLVNLISLVKSRALYIRERQEEEQSTPEAAQLKIQPLQTVKVIHIAQSRALQIIQANTLETLEHQTGTKVILQSEDKAEICSSREPSYYFHNYDASLLEDALSGRRWPECEEQGNPEYWQREEERDI